MNYRVMSVADIESVIPLYIAYYNQVDGSSWTPATVYKRIHQVITREDAYCLLLEDATEVLGFAIGYCEQYDDLVSYDLTEIVIAWEHQNKGLGTAFMRELESRVKQLGASLIQLQSVNDAMHESFYCDKLSYRKASNLVLMSKCL